MLPEPFTPSFDESERESERARLFEILIAANASESVEALAAYCLDTLGLVVPFRAGFFMLCESEPARLTLVMPRHVPLELQNTLRALVMPPEFHEALGDVDAMAPLAERIRELLQPHRLADPLIVSLRTAQVNVGVLVLANDLHPELRAVWQTEVEARQEFLSLVGTVLGAAFKRILKHEKLSAEARGVSEFLNQAEDGYWQTDGQGRITIVNSAALRTLKRPADEVLGKRIDELSDADPKGLREIRERVRREGRVRDFVLQVRASDGELRTIRESLLATRDAQNNITGIHGIFRDITEQQSTQRALERSNHELGLLHELATRLNNTIGKLEALNAALDLIVSLTHADAIGIVLIHPTEGHYDLVAHRGLAPELVEAYSYAPFDRAIYEPGFDPETTWNLIEYIVLTRRTLTMADFQAMPRFGVRPIVAFGYQSLLAFPMNFDAQVYGVVMVGARAPDHFDEHTIQVVGGISAQLGLALRNQELVADLQRQVWQMKAVTQTGRVIQHAPSAEKGLPQVVREIRQTLHASYVVLHLLRQDFFEIVTASDTRESRRTFPIAAYERRLLESDAPLIVNDIEKGENDPEQGEILKRLQMRAAVGVRLFAHPTTLGILFVNQDTPREWAPDELQLIQTFAQQIAYALENKRLLDETKQQLLELQALAQVGHLISSALLPDEALLPVAEEIARVLHADYVSFHLREGNILLLIAESQETNAPRSLPILPHQYRILDELDITRVNDRNVDAITSQQSDYLKRFDLTADLGVPLVAGQKALGILYIAQQRAHMWTDDETRLAQTFAQQIASALTNARLLRESQMQVKELVALSRSAHLISMSRSPEHALPQAARELGRVLGADYVGFHLIEGANLREMTDAGYRLWNLVYPIQAYQLPIIEHFQKIVVHDRERDARDETSRAVLERYNIMADVAVPLVSRNRTLGILFVSQFKARRWQPGEVRLIETYAQQIAGVLDNVRLLNEGEARLHALDRLAVFNEIAVMLPDEPEIIELALNAGKDLLGADLMTIILMEDETLGTAKNSNGKVVDPQPPPITPRIRRILDAKMPYVYDPAQDDEPDGDMRARAAFHHVQICLFVPIVTANQIIGLLNFGFQSAHVFTEEEKQLAQSAANQLAMAFTNARLIRAQKRQIQNLTDHSKFSLWCGTVHNSETLQRQAIEQICKMLEAQAGSVRLVRGDFLAPGARYGYREREMQALPIPLDEYLKQVLTPRKVRAISDLQNEPNLPPRWYEHIAREGFRALLSVPMSTEHHLIGMLTLFHDEVHTWDPLEIQFAETLANTLALALANAELMERAERKSDELRATIDSVFSGVMTTNKEGVIQTWSSKAQEITGMSEQEMLGKRWHLEGARVGEARRDDRLILEAMADNQVRFSIAPRYWAHPMGRELSLREVAAPLHDHLGNVRGAVLAFWDRAQEQEGERAKIDFINEVAHEMGNKLSVMILGAQQLLRPTLTEKRRAQYTQVIADMRGDLEIFHERFMAFQRERVREDIQESEINLRDMVQERLAPLRAAKTGHRFQVGGTFDFVLADQHRLQVVLENLFTNAIKYAPARSVISIRARLPAADQLVLSIHNRGEPIPIELQPHLFERWQRGDTDIPGTGLGLWLVQTKLFEMGGEISFESSARGGTTFFVTLRRRVQSLTPTDSHSNLRGGPDAAEGGETA